MICVFWKDEKNENETTCEKERQKITKNDGHEFVAMMQARQGILFNFLKLHEEALAIDDAFEIDEALKIVEH